MYICLGKYTKIKGAFVRRALSQQQHPAVFACRHPPLKYYSGDKPRRGIEIDAAVSYSSLVEPPRPPSGRNAARETISVPAPA
jgi:hypothetical protein